ncbi:hypothetical protein K501DRAFT_168591 [Backusella circina FSU 941]|nr:hypothetical protein K501DRAFT_168591 [Backusella circina FSU 941]
MVYSHKSTLLSLCLIAGAFSSPFTKRDTMQPWTTVQSESSFCLFLPPGPGQEIAVTEDFGIPFCTTENLIENANILPEGFIRNAHFAETNDYIQVTGYFNRSKYSLSETDGGGQYDNHALGKPIGAQCKGYDYFVNLVEPDVERYCIRCCHNKEDCNTGKSGFGCLRVIDGDYTLPNATLDFSNEDVDSTYEYVAPIPLDDSLAQSYNSSIPALESLKAEVLVNSTNNATIMEHVHEKWDSLMDYLTGKDPKVDTQLEQLQTVASALTTVEQWKAYLGLTTDMLNQFQEKGDAMTS